MKCEREFTQAGIKKTKWQYAYFHLMKTCVQKKFSEFTLADLEISAKSKDIARQSEGQVEIIGSSHLMMKDDLAR